VGVVLDKGSYPIFGGSPSIFTEWLKLATSNLVFSLCMPGPITKLHAQGKIGIAIHKDSSLKFVVPLYYFCNG